MTITRRRTLAVLAGAALAPAGAFAQGFPTRTIKIVVPYPAGGPVDALARLLTPELGALGQNAIVENVGGGAGAIGARQVAKAEPDGHTLVLSTNQTHATNYILLKDPGYEAKDFAAVAGLADLQHVLVVRNDLAVRSVAELVGHAKANPGKLNYGSTGNGSASHLAMELFKAKTATDLVHVPFRGAAPMAQELVAGRIDVAFATLFSARFRQAPCGRSRSQAPSGRRSCRTCRCCPSRGCKAARPTPGSACGHRPEPRRRCWPGSRRR